MKNSPILIFTAVLAFAVVAEASETHDLPLTPLAEVHGTVSGTENALEHASPFADKQVRVVGVVHQLLAWTTWGESPRYGFMIQSAKGSDDGDANTSEGLMVYTHKTNEVPLEAETYRPSVGDEVELVGQLSDRHGQTEMSLVSAVKVLRRGLVLDEVLDVMEVNPPPDEAEANRYWERLEGMRVKLAAGAIVNGHRVDDKTTGDGMVYLSSAGGSLAQRDKAFERRVFRDAHPLDDVPEKVFDNGNGHRIVVSSFGVKANTGDPLHRLAPVVTFNETAASVYGGVIYNYSTYKVAVDRELELTANVMPVDNHAPAANDPSTSFSVATYNVENLYDFENDPYDGCDFEGDEGVKGVRKPYDYVAKSEEAFKIRVEKLAAHVVDYLHSPDLIMVQELEDQDIYALKAGRMVLAKKNDADGGNDGLQHVALAIHKRGGPAYGIANDRDGADARGIVTAFMYRKDRVQLMPVSRMHAVFGNNPRLDKKTKLMDLVKDVQNPKAFNATYGEKDDKVFSRAMQVAGFQVWKNGIGKGRPVPLYLLNNHFSSRPDVNVERRRLQAQLNADVAKALQRLDRNARIIIGGDLNVYPRPDDPLPEEKSDQLAAIYDTGLLNTYNALLRDKPENAYTYVYKGQAQTLDHFFVSKALAAKLSDVQVVHLNCDYTGREDPEYVFGASDHDPILARFRF